jgi:uncharacterized Zn finger protein
MWYDDYYPRFPRSKPREAKGGIRSQSKRGSFGESWWAKRWIEVLESFDIGGRLGRGRSYARKGQVLSIDIDKGIVKAKVQGSQPRPYEVEIELKPLVAGDWTKVTTALAGQALFAAKLLAGGMPQEIETVFEKAKVSLFPRRAGDLQTECSCPDWSNPCKHVAAVYYLIGEEFDRDPFLLFKLRGLSREELFERLKGTEEKPAKAKGRKSSRKDAKVAREPLPADALRFWAAPTLPENWLGEVQAPPVNAAVLKRLGNFPFWRGRERFVDALEPMYRYASETALEILAGETEGTRADGR